MVTLHYFSNYFVLLVLQSSVFLYAQEPPVSSSTSLTEPPPTPSVDIDKKSFPVLANKQNVTLLDLTIPQDNLHPPPQPQPQLNTDNVNTSNTSIGKEFPQSPQNGQRICVLNETREIPPTLNGNAKNTSTSKNVPKTTGTQINCNITHESPLNESSKVEPDELKDLLDNSKETVHTISDEVPKINITWNQGINDQVQFIDDDNEYTEENIRAASQHQVDVPAVPLLQGQLAAILAAVFVVISVIAYFALLSWRRYLENRYGNREMLVNEDELNDRDDMRHFSI